MPTTLLDLPNELLSLVAGNFALLKPRKPAVQHPHGHDVTEGPSSDRQSLLALSATCRRLRDAVQPLLYHAAYPDTAEVEFARTLTDRPDLAAQVRELYYSNNAHEDRKSRPLYTKPVNKHALKQSRFSGKSNFNELAAKHPHELELEDLWEDEKGNIRGNGYLGQWEDVNPSYFAICDAKQRVLDRNLLVQTLCQVPEIRELTLWYEPFDIKRLPSGILPRLRHLRIFKPDLSWGQESYVIQNFSEAMPNLQILDCHFVARLITETSSTITELNLNCCPMTREDFDQVGAGFINLQRLSLNADAVFDLRREFADISIGSLLPRSLQHVELCLGGTQAFGVQPYLDWLGVRTERCPDLTSVTICHHLPEPQPEVANLFRATGVTYSCRKTYGRDEDKLTAAHLIDPMSQLRGYDNYPGWRFWDPEVESMTFLDEIQEE